MFRELSQRFLSALQLTRMALVFTAIADAQCALLLRSSSLGLPLLNWFSILSVLAISVGLYGFGMSLNDIIDRRRDQQIASHRPLPSGRIGLATAYFICSFLMFLAAVGGSLLMTRESDGWISLLLVLWTGALIAFYNFAGKYLVGAGLLTLGLIRFFHAIIPAPHIPLLWHPLLLLNHVTILSTIAYVWEEKRPMLTAAHWVSVVGGLVALDAVAIGGLFWRAWRHPGVEVGITAGLIYPAGAVVLFAAVCVYLRMSSLTSRIAGQRLMLYGLLWLIVYDVSFTAGYVGLLPAGILLILLPVAFACVQLMRWWSKILLMSQRPEFKRE